MKVSFPLWWSSESIFYFSCFQISLQGGNRPINSSIEDSDEEFDPLVMAPDNELEKVHIWHVYIVFWY